MEWNNNKQYTVKYGKRAYLFSASFIGIIIGLYVLLWLMLDLLPAILYTATGIIGIVVWLIIFVRTKIIIDGENIKADLAFCKKINLKLSEIVCIERGFGRIYFTFESGAVIKTYFYMDNINRFTEYANKQLQLKNLNTEVKKDAN